MKHDFIIEEITFASIVKAGRGAKMHKNRSSHGIAIFPGGERTYCFDDKKFKVEGSTIVYFPKGSTYTIHEKVTFDCYVINFEMPDGVTFKPFSFKVKNINSYLESFKLAHRMHTRKNAGYASKTKSELYNILYNMQFEYSLPYSTCKIIQPAIDYIHANYYKENINVEHLASLCGISAVHLRNTFIKKFATSPIKYINELKMTRARDLLRSQFYTVKQVCSLSGYNDESYFSREFKKAFNVTPREYAKASRK